MHRTRINLLGRVAFVAVALAAPAWCRAAENLRLHERIDVIIESAAGGDVAPAASDAEFLRRVYLDLAGFVPPASDVRAFLDDPASDKRVRLIDRLLAAPSYARRMQQVFDVMLMQRRPKKHVEEAAWQKFLRDSFAQNKPYNQLVREILAADGTTPESRAAARFLLDREGEPNLLTKDVGRLFLGRDMQCAQCHDHPLIDGYKQDHYYGLFAFFSRSTVFTDAKAKLSMLAEKGEGDVSFKSVFDPKKETKNTGPHLIDGPILDEPKLAKGQEYFIAPAKDVRPVPKFSRRALLASVATDGSSPDFNRNIVNRLWALLMGRGLVHPLELHHADNPPSHPELLDLLAEEFVAMKFDIKQMLRELALTRTYQRTSELPESMGAEQAAPERFAVAPLRPLVPEQLAWSLMEATGTSAAQRLAQRNTLAADPRLAAILALDPQRAALEETMIEERAYEQLKGSVPQFVGLYGGAPGEPESEYQATVHQALFLSNGPTIKSWIGSALAPRLATIGEPSAAIEELYVSVLSRRPYDDERLEATEYLVRAESPKTAYEELAWALLASAEFRFNH
jgi:hypothetical protein